MKVAISSCERRRFWIKCSTFFVAQDRFGRRSVTIDRGTHGRTWLTFITTFSGFIKAREKDEQRRRKDRGRLEKERPENQRQKRAKSRNWTENHWRNREGKPSTQRKKNRGVWRRNRGKTQAKPRKKKQNQEEKNQKNRGKTKKTQATHIAKIQTQIRKKRPAPSSVLHHKDWSADREGEKGRGESQISPAIVFVPAEKEQQRTKDYWQLDHHCLLSFISKLEETECNQRKKQKERTQAEESHGDHCYCLRHCYYFQCFQNQERKQRKTEGRNEALPNQCTNHQQLRLRCQAHQTR